MPDQVSATPGRRGEQEGMTGAMLLRTLGPFAAKGRPIETPKPYLSVQELAKQWQLTGRGAIWGEAHAARLGLEPDRIHELIGCIAAAGEQLGLAWTAQQDGQRWTSVDSDGKPMAIRAHAEVCCYFTLGAANAVGNATLRTLLLNASAKSDITTREKRTFAPFSDHRKDWPSFNDNLIKTFKLGATAVGTAEVQQLVLITERLRQDDRFLLMEKRRGLDYHRWRPQSIDGGVPRGSFWEDVPGVGRRLSGRSKGTFHADPYADHMVVAEIATNGLVALADAMHAWLTQWPSAMEGVGAKIYRTPQGPKGAPADR